MTIAAHTCHTDHADKAAQMAAAASFRHAADFLEHAADMIAKGTPADAPEVAQWVGFANPEGHGADRLDVL